VVVDVGAAPLGPIGGEGEGGEEGGEGEDFHLCDYSRERRLGQGRMFSSRLVKVGCGFPANSQSGDD